MAWGVDGSSWDDCVDMANIEQFDFKDIPSESFVMTTWHENETLSEVFWFAKQCAFHPAVDLQHTLLLHIATDSRETEILREYSDA